MKDIEYEMIWRNKWITSNAESIDDMILALQSSIQELNVIKSDGVVGDFDGAGDDYIYFRTSNQEIAKKHDMNEIENYEKDHDDDCEFRSVSEETNDS